MTDPAIPAATLILVRDRDGRAPELLMVERAEGMAFAGGALVFPGGRIDPADAEFAERLGLDDGGAAVAAVRETLEETAVPAGLSPIPDARTARALQQALLDGGGFAQLLAEAGLTLDCAALQPFARWVPKFHAVRRFDTLFLIAAAPPGDWQPNIVAGECAGAFWLSAADVLERERRGEARLIFPTRRNLERLALHGSVAAIRADAAAYPIEPITPWVEEQAGERFVTIPGNLGYPVVREKLEGLWGG
jgi:8-oxo-dGTP pyrophosphatase MutT (NUDIX family)